jgi:hypothetical protein
MIGFEPKRDSVKTRVDLMKSFILREENSFSLFSLITFFFTSAFKIDSAS